EGGKNPLLRQYVEQGGFLLAEACCGEAAFDKGFRDLMKRLFPDYPLKRLPPDHPLWAASDKFAIPPEKRGQFELWGIEMGCRTVVVYSPQDVSCWWESNQYEQGNGRLAFHVGANVIAYATGLEPPRDRGSRADVVRDNPGDRKVPRGAL